MSVRPSVSPSVRPSSLPYYFRTTNMAGFEGKKPSNDIKINGTMSDDEVVTSDVPPWYLLPKEKDSINEPRENVVKNKKQNC